MTIDEAFAIISPAEPDACLHADHICGEAIAHDLAHCALGESQVYTDADAAADTPAALADRLE